MHGQKNHLWLVALLLLLGLALASTALAQGPVDSEGTAVVEEFATVEEAVSWLNQRGLAVSPNRHSVQSNQSTIQAVADNCNPAPISRNPSHNYPLDQNSSEAIVFNGLWCGSQNIANLQVGTDWWGYQGKSVREWGFITLRDADAHTLITVYAFDMSGIPDQPPHEAVQRLIQHQFPLCQPPVRIEWEANLQMTGSGVATRTASTVFTPACGSVTLEKSGKPLLGTVWELIKVEADSSRSLVERITVDSTHLREQNGKQVAILNWNNLSGPITTTSANYELQERIDLQTGTTRVIPRDLDSGQETWNWKLSLDATHQVVTIRAFNPLYQVFLPICIKSGPGGPVEVECPQDIADVLIQGQYVRRDDDTSKAGFAYALPTLHPDQQVAFDLTKLLNRGFTPQLVQLYVDNKPYGHYDVSKPVHTFTTMLKNFDERKYQLGPYKLYVFHVELLVGYDKAGNPIYCYLRYLLYLDP